MEKRYCTLESNSPVAPGVYRMTLSSDQDLRHRCGQFVEVAVPEKFLRRPLSVSLSQADRLTLLYKVVGGGTAALAALQPGAALDLLTGLGNGFDIEACRNAALLIGGAASIDYNPVSAEEKQVAEANISGKVTWTQYGKVYHIYVDDENWCQHLNNSDTVKVGTVEEAIAAGKTRLCKTCAHNHGLEGIEDLPLGGNGPD